MWRRQRNIFLEAIFFAFEKTFFKVSVQVFAFLCMISLACRVSHCLSTNHNPELQCVICTGVTRFALSQLESSLCIISFKLSSVRLALYNILIIIENSSSKSLLEKSFFLHLGIRLINQTLASDADEARALSHATEHIDIYSNSWEPLGWGNVVRGPGHLSQLALRRGTEKVTC